MAWSADERRVVALLATEISGADNLGSQGLDFVLGNLEKRLRDRRIPSLQDYLRLAATEEREYEELVSSLTVHTTSWFREEPHFLALEDLATQFAKRSPGDCFRVWSAACSTGEEAYSIGIRLARVQRRHPRFEFEVWASDLDARSVRVGQKGVYAERHLPELGDEDRACFLSGSGETEGWLAVAPEIRERIRFFQHDLTQESRGAGPAFFDVIFCRNVLIYFSVKAQEEILAKLVRNLQPQGQLILGHSDTMPRVQGYRRLEGCRFVREIPSDAEVPNQRSRLLVVDDSATLRRVLNSVLSTHFQITEADSAEEAERLVQDRRYDLITLDLNLPGEHGVSWLRRFRSRDSETPIVIVSESSPSDAEKVFGALENGAQDYIVKSSLLKNPQSVCDLAVSLVPQRGAPLLQNQTAPLRIRKNFAPQALLIGASTGGPQALMELLQSFPLHSPPVVVVQHIGAEFARSFAKRLAERSGLALGDPESAEPLQTGTLYMALRDHHLHLAPHGHRSLRLETRDHDKVNGHRPSVDVLFRSASLLGVDALAVLLTGMGKDGAEGLKDLYQGGRCLTMAQDASSSVVFGMPKAAIETGTVSLIGDLAYLRRQIEEWIRK